MNSNRFIKHRRGKSIDDIVAAIKVNAVSGGSVE